MKREILFRGKRKDNEEWAYGYFVKDVYGEAIYPINPIQDGFPNEITDVDPDTVGQFMGLTDKNGNKIFEGDILRKWKSYYVSNKADIEYVPTSITDVATMAEFPLFWLENEDFGDERDGFEDAEEWEIIGNIHDNPELITKKQ